MAGIGLSVLGTGCIVVNDAAMKWVVSEHPIGQAICVRSLLVLAAIGVLATWRQRILRAVAWRSLRHQCWAALLLVVPIFVYIYSLQQLPLSLATMVFFVNPLFVTVLAPLLAKEQVGWRRRCAVLVGFAGAALVIRPPGAEFQWILLGPVLAAFLAAWRDLYLRKVLVGETSLSVLTFSTLIVAAGSAATYAGGWPDLSVLDAALLTVAAAGFGLGIYFTTDALRFADASLLAIFKYSAIIWALLIGFGVWGEIPTPAVWLGAALIVASGCYIAVRERYVRIRRAFRAT